MPWKTSLHTQLRSNRSLTRSMRESSLLASARQMPTQHANTCRQIRQSQHHTQLAPTISGLPNVHPLKLVQRSHHPPRLAFDLALEGVEFSVWMVTSKDGLSEAKYESMRQELEDELNAPAGTEPSPKRSIQKVLEEGITEAPRKSLLSGQHDRLVGVVAVYDAGIGAEEPLQCSFHFCYPLDRDPVSAISSVSESLSYFGSMSRLVPVVDAMHGADRVARHHAEAKKQPAITELG